MNRREFLQVVSAAAAVAVLPVALPPEPAAGAAPARAAAAANRHLLNGVIVNCSGIRETAYRIAEHSTETVFYSYDTDLVYAVGADTEGVHLIRRIWADGVCIWGDGAVAPFEVRLKDLNGVKLAAFDNFPLEPFGNRVPEFVFEVS
jgi:hypothetical protein